MIQDTQYFQNKIIEAVQADKVLYDPTNPDPTKRGLTSTSNVAIWKLWTYIVAFATSLFKQLFDQYKIETEAIVIAAPAGTPAWVQYMVFRFQYSAVTPQVIKLDTTTLAAYYPVVSPSLQIVTLCAVTTTPNKVALVKCAKGGTTPVKLTTLENQALTTYLDYIDFAGISFSVISVDPDLIMMGYDVYFDGQYSASIVSDVKTAITTYLSSSNINNFNGTQKLSSIEDTIQAVAGVTDVVARQVEVRPASITSANAFKMVDNYDVLLRKYDPYAGYLIPDTDSGRTLDDSLIFIPS